MQDHPSLGFPPGRCLQRISSSLVPPPASSLTLRIKGDGLFLAHLGSHAYTRETAGEKQGRAGKQAALMVPPLAGHPARVGTFHPYIQLPMCPSSR